MAVKPPRFPGLHVTIVLFIYWTNICLGIKKDPRSQFYGHALVQPTIIYNDAREKRDLDSIKVQNEEKMTVSFLAYDRQFVLDLSMNNLLLPSHYFEKHHENGISVIRSPMKENYRHCHYQGQIRGINHSVVAISTCNGLSGIINDGNEMFYIHPDSTSDSNSHFLFRAKDLKPHNFTCGVPDSSNILMKSQFLESLKRNRRSTILQDPHKSNKKSRYVELIIVNDNKEFRDFKEDKNAVFERSKEIANIVNGLYSPLNIYIALVGVIIWSHHDEIKLSTDADATLSNFLNYRKERLAQEHPNDNAQLITAMTFDGGVSGKALKGPICTHEYSGGVNIDHSHVVGLVATTVAHQLGHNFGMEHDTDECQCQDEKCIMAPSSSSTSPRHWSSCSLEYLDMAYSQGMDHCLKNYPVSIIGPVCGNDFLDKGEECDCGLKEFCDNPCCNATSCQLFPYATCAMGECCDTKTCQVKKIATLCRDVISECDLPEYCDGMSEYCPADTFHQNGEECGNGEAYCYNGECQSHLDQCKLLWGRTGKAANWSCFEQNSEGNVNGNCGYNRISGTYKACRKEDNMCGMLHCTHLNERLEYGMESAAVLVRSYINVKGKTITCRSAIVDLGLFSIDPGLAPNGAKCGDGKACVNQKCVPVNSIKNGECLNGCNGNGVCNNKRNCHCDKGYGPPYCVSDGPGGSIDSGPASDLSSCGKNTYFSSKMHGCVDCPKNSHTDSEGKTSLRDCVCNSGYVGDPEEGVECEDYSQCGLGREDVVIGGRILGGEQSVAPWPWMAALYFFPRESRNIDELKFKCGGSIINENFILTAAHCMYQANFLIRNYRLRDKEEIIVKLGLTDIKNETFAQEFEVKLMHIHPEYRSGKFDYDIALLQLDRPINFNAYVRPICLPPKELPTDAPFYKHDEYGWVIGWGQEGYAAPGDRTVTFTTTKHLKELRLPIQSTENCTRSLENKKYKTEYFTERMFCAGDGKIGSDTCKGDSGGPLMQPWTNSEGEIYWTQVGIISWGIGCGFEDLYGYYTHVHRLHYWIDEIINIASKS